MFTKLRMLPEKKGRGLLGTVLDDFRDPITAAVAVAYLLICTSIAALFFAVAFAVYRGAL